MTVSLLALVLPLIAGEVAADAAAPTEDLFDAWPVSGTTLGTNSRLLASGSDRFLVTHGDGSVEELVADTEAHFMFTRTFYELRPQLVPGETITLERVCEGCGGDELLSWPVGDGPDTTVPAFTDGDVDDGGIVGLYDNDPHPLSQRWGFNVAVWLPALQSPEEVYVRIEGDGAGPASSFMDDARPWVTFEVDGRDERTACFDAIAIDSAANESAPYNFCVDLVDDRSGFPGCSQSNAASAMAFASLAALLRRRRR